VTHQDNVFGLLVEANPIPEIEELDLIDVGGPEYLATLEQRSSEVTQVDTKQELPTRAPRRGLILGVAASVAVILSASALFLALNDDEPVAGTTTVSTVNDQVELQGQGNRNSHSFELEGGSYSVETTVSGECSYTFELSRSATGHMVEVITSMSEPGTTTVTISDIPADSYFVNVNTDTEFSCPWSQVFTRS
jgi:hypothetical protein